MAPGTLPDPVRPGQLFGFAPNMLAAATRAPPRPARPDTPGTSPRPTSPATPVSRTYKAPTDPSCHMKQGPHHDQAVGDRLHAPPCTRSSARTCRAFEGL